jgi:hypothetical protein
VSDNSDASAILLLLLTFSGFIVVAGALNNQPSIYASNQTQTTQYIVVHNETQLIPNNLQNLSKEENMPTNLQPITAFYSDANGAASSYAAIVTHNGRTCIRMGPDYVRGTREVDGAWISISPGDHIVFSAYVETEACPASTDMQGGACIGFDLEIYNSSAAPGSLAIADVSSDGTQAGHPSGYERGWGVGSTGYSINGELGLTQVNGLVVRVPWNTARTQLKFDFIVPSTYYAYVTTGASYPNAMACTPAQLNMMVVWFEGRNLVDNAYIWFDTPELYINNDVVDVPVFTPSAGTYNAVQNVVLSCGTSGADIHYTDDGSTPDAGDTTYTVPLNVPIGATVLKALAVKAGLTDSAVVTANYQVNDPIVPSAPAVHAFLVNMRR